MSYTEIYKFKKDGNATLFAEIQNAWRGAMSIWNILDKKYLPPYVPDWAVRLKMNEPGKEFYRMHDPTNEEGRKEVWGIYYKEGVSQTDKIVIGSTFDNVIVMREDIPKLVEAFRNFEGETSLKEQADVIEKLFNNDEDMLGISWNQTSVNADAWSILEDDKAQPYNILKNDKHWNLFEDLKQ